MQILLDERRRGAARWREMERLPKGAEAQCAVCGKFFSSDTAFVAHQKANYRAKRRENLVKCLNPAEVKQGRNHLVFDEGRAAWSLASPFG